MHCRTRPQSYMGLGTGEATGFYLLPTMRLNRTKNAPVYDDFAMGCGMADGAALAGHWRTWLHGLASHRSPLNSSDILWMPPNAKSWLKQQVRTFVCEQMHADWGRWIWHNCSWRSGNHLWEQSTNYFGSLRTQLGRASTGTCCELLFERRSGIIVRTVRRSIAGTGSRARIRCRDRGFGPRAVPAGVDFQANGSGISWRQGDVVRVLKSSATSSQTPSRVVLDRVTRDRQMRTLAFLLSALMGSARRPFVVLDAAAAPGRTWSFRRA